MIPVGTHLGIFRSHKAPDKHFQQDNDVLGYRCTLVEFLSSAHLGSSSLHHMVLMAAPDLSPHSNTQACRLDSYLYFDWQ